MALPNSHGWNEQRELNETQNTWSKLESRSGRSTETIQQQLPVALCTSPATLVLYVNPADSCEAPFIQPTSVKHLRLTSNSEEQHTHEIKYWSMPGMNCLNAAAALMSSNPTVYYQFFPPSSKLGWVAFLSKAWKLKPLLPLPPK